MSKPRRPVEPLLERLIQGKLPKQIGHEFGITNSAVDYVLLRYVRETGCKTLFQAVAQYARQTNPANRPPEGVD